MTDKERQEINKFIAEHLFGRNKHGDEGCNLRFEVKHFCEVFCGEEDICINHAPDFCSDARAVLEKLTCKSGMVIESYNVTNQPIPNIKVSLVIKAGQGNDYFEVYGDTIHEAICRAAVEYLKAQETKKKGE